MCTSPTWSVPPESAGALADWLDTCEAELLHPTLVEQRLRRQGWAPAPAAATADGYRRRFNEHALGYSALLVTTGVAALAAGTAGHLLTNGLNGRVNRNDLAIWLTLALCVLPFAAWAHVWAARVDRDDPVAVWSRSRRALAQTLLVACATVGAVRLLIYTARLIGALIGASWAAGGSLWAGAINVGITLVIALPLGLWSYRFLHRFDAEDPTAPPTQRQRRRS
jgi:hypothetical protein